MSWKEEFWLNLITIILLLLGVVLSITFMITEALGVAEAATVVIAWFALIYPLAKGIETSLKSRAPREVKLFQISSSNLENEINNVLKSTSIRDNVEINVHDHTQATIIVKYNYKK